MRTLIFVLTLGTFSCSGLPVYDYELPVTEEALNASLARINSQSWGTNLYGVVGSRVTRVDMWDSNTYSLELQFSVRETSCTKASGRDPATCAFKLGPFVPAGLCSSLVQVSGERVSRLSVRCRWGSPSSESLSSEEMMYVPMMSPSWQGSSHREGVFAPEASAGRGSSPGDWHRPSHFSPDKRE
ncbi:PREDICTED: secreted phosphoprotein 24 [Chaetura pelagica]|nr:PREDICTED: secreted phosphoprotein 24 [Chaetura pelagica]